jgi:O-antigen/teichoic acid export membrane protein
MNGARDVVKNFMSLLSSQIITSLLGFAVTVYLARVLGADSFGKIVFAQAVLVYFILFANLGLNILGVRKVARDKENIKKYVNNIITLRLTLAVLSFVLLSFLTFFMPKTDDIKHLIFIFGLSLFTSALILEWPYQGIEKMQFVAVSRVADKVIYAGLIFLLVAGVRHLFLIPYFWLAGSGAACLFLISMYIKNYGMICLEFNLPFWKDLLKQSVPMGTGFLIMQVFYHFDDILLAFLKGEEYVGWYNTAYKIIYFILLAGSLYFVAIFPTISKYYKQSSQKLKSLLTRSSKLMASIVLPLAVGGTLIARPLMMLLYGEEYSNGVIVFQILIWTVAVFFLNYVYAYLLLACDREKKYLIGISAGTLTNICLNIILIPLFGLVGASVATVAGSLVMFMYMYIQARRVVKIQLLRFVYKPFIAAFCMGSTLYFSGVSNVLILLPLGVGVFSAVFILLELLCKKR